MFWPHYHTLVRSKRCASRRVVECDSPGFILVSPNGHSAGESHFAAVALRLALSFPTGARPMLSKRGKVIAHSRAVPAIPAACVVLSRDAQDGGSCPLGKHHHGSRRSPPVVVRSGIFYQHCLSHKMIRNQNLFCKSLPLFTAENDVCRRKGGGGVKGGKWKRKLLMSLNHERLGPGLE